VFPSLSGAAKFDFAPATGRFKEFRGNAIIALGGDRAPFATSGRTLKSPVGYKIVRLDPDTRQARDFVRNTRGGPASRAASKAKGKATVMLERPVDVKFGADGKMYILDYGRVDMKNGKPRVKAGTGRLFVLEPIEEESPTTAPVTR
jgi:hypothetical protein